MSTRTFNRLNFPAPVGANPAETPPCPPVAVFGNGLFVARCPTQDSSLSRNKITRASSVILFYVSLSLDLGLPNSLLKYKNHLFKSEKKFFNKYSCKMKLACVLHGIRVGGRWCGVINQACDEKSEYSVTCE